MLRILDRLRPGYFYPCAAVVIAAIVLGGGTRSGFLSDVLLQLIAIPLLVVSVSRLSALPSLGGARVGVVFCGAVLLLPLLQLIPLPPAVWTGLPHRQAEVEAFALAGQQLPWMPISVSPRATWLSALSLLVPVSVFLGVILLDYKERSALSLTVLACGLISVFLGLSQVAQGPSSPLRLFDFSNTTEAIGFFANRNHFAALLYSLMLFAAAWVVVASAAPASSAPGAKYDTKSIVALAASFTLLVALVAGEVIARSRAGLALTIVALLGAFALSVVSRRDGTGITPTRILVGSIGLATVFATQFALYRVMERLSGDPLQDARVAFAHTTVVAAKSFMPFGSGMGTFVPVYALFEKREDLLMNAYANRAHDDVLELWLESGVFGIGLLVAFLGWFAMRAIAIWRQPMSEEARDIDRYLARAATVAVALMLAHSVADYPLRTGALAAVFALACAFMFEPVGIRREARASTKTRDDVAISETRLRPVAPSPSPVWTAPFPAGQPSLPAGGPFAGAGAALPPAAAPGGVLWDDVEWPEEWRRPSTKSTRHDPGKK